MRRRRVIVLIVIDFWLQLKQLHRLPHNEVTWSLCLTVKDSQCFESNCRWHGVFAQQWLTHTGWLFCPLQIMNHKKTYAVLDYDTFILFQTLVELTDSYNSLVWRCRISTYWEFVLLTNYTTILLYRYFGAKIWNFRCWEFALPDKSWYTYDFHSGGVTFAYCLRVLVVPH